MPTAHAISRCQPCSSISRSVAFEKVDVYLSELGDVNRYLTEPLNRVDENYMNASAQISLSLCIVWGIVYLLLCWHIKHRGLFVALTLAGLVVTWFVCLGRAELVLRINHCEGYDGSRGYCCGWRRRRKARIHSLILRTCG